jgi:hypothetical protein
MNWLKANWKKLAAWTGVAAVIGFILWLVVPGIIALFAMM